MVAARVDRHPKVEEERGPERGIDEREKGNGCEGGKRCTCSSCLLHMVESVRLVMMTSSKEE